MSSTEGPRINDVSSSWSGSVSVTWEDHDRHPMLAIVALVGLPLALLLAVFGLPPVDIHGPLHYLGVMGPTCGMTRSVMWFTRGQIATAWDYNPAGLLVVPGGLMVLARAVLGWSTGRWFEITVSRRRWLVAALVLAGIVLTVRQQLRVDLLT